MIRYGILDEEGKVVRWVYERPSSDYEYIVVKQKRQPKPKFDLSQIEDAPF